jgi:hypothetical protein
MPPWKQPGQQTAPVLTSYDPSTGQLLRRAAHVLYARGP